MACSRWCLEDGRYRGDERDGGLAVSREQGRSESGVEGGSSAAIEPAHSISGMRAVKAAAAANPKKFNGYFVQYDGIPLVW